MKRAINGRIRDGYTLEDITRAIDNYATVLGGTEYFFSYRWTLVDFLTRGLDRFVDEARPLENFRRGKKPEACKNAGAPYPRSGMVLSSLEACGCDLCRRERERRGGRAGGGEQAPAHRPGEKLDPTDIKARFEAARRRIAGGISSNLNRL